MTREAKRKRLARGILPPALVDVPHPIEPRSFGADERIARRREQVLALRAARMTYREIARQLGVSLATVYEDEMAELDASAARRADLADRQLDLEVATCARLIKAGMKAALNGSVPAITAVTQVQTRLARLLGLDAPTKIAPTDPTGTQRYDALTDEELRARLHARLVDVAPPPDSAIASATETDPDARPESTDVADDH